MKLDTSVCQVHLKFMLKNAQRDTNVLLDPQLQYPAQLVPISLMLFKLTVINAL